MLRKNKRKNKKKVKINHALKKPIRRLKVEKLVENQLLKKQLALQKPHLLRLK